MSSISTILENILSTNSDNMSYMKLAPQEFLTWFTSQLDSRNLGIREAARVIGVSHPTVSDIVTHHKQPSLDVAKKIARGFAVDENYVLTLAALIDKVPEADRYDQLADRLVRNLKKEDSKKRAVDYLELLIQQEERAEQERVAKNNKNHPITQPR